MSQRVIPPNLEGEILAKSGDGYSGQQISKWLLDVHGVKASRPAVQRLLAKIAKEHAPAAKAIVRSALSKSLTSGLQSLDGILQRAEEDEKSAGKLEEIEKEVQRIATVDIAQAYEKDGTLLPLHSMPEDVRRAIAGVEVLEQFEGQGENRIKVGDLVKVKFWNKPQTLETLAKMRDLLSRRELAIKARAQQLDVLRLRFELSGAGGNTSEESVETRARLLKKLDALG